MKSRKIPKSAIVLKLAKNGRFCLRFKYSVTMALAGRIFREFRLFCAGRRRKAQNTEFRHRKLNVIRALKEYWKALGQYAPCTCSDIAGGLGENERHCRSGGRAPVW